MVALRDAADLLQTAVPASIAAAKLTDADAAAIRLAQEYAEAIDNCCGNPEILRDLGPKLLAVLESLGLTPLGRAKAKENRAAAPKTGRLAEIIAASNR